jgi:hypothetical protein
MDAGIGITREMAGATTMSAMASQASQVTSCR